MGIMDLLMSGRQLDPGRQKPMAIPPGWLQGPGPDMSQYFAVPGFEGEPDLPPPPAMNGPPPYSSGIPSPPPQMNGPPPYSSGLPPEQPQLGPPIGMTGPSGLPPGMPGGPGWPGPEMNGPPPYSSGATQPDTPGQLRTLLEQMFNQPPQGEREKLRPRPPLRDISMRLGGQDPALAKWMQGPPQYAGPLAQPLGIEPLWTERKRGR